MSCNDFRSHMVAECWHSFLNHKTSKHEFVIHSKATLIKTLDFSICFHCARCRDYLEELKCIFGSSWKRKRQDIKSYIFKEKLFRDTTPNLHVTLKIIINPPCSLSSLIFPVTFILPHINWCQFTNTQHPFRSLNHLKIKNYLTF